MKALHFTDEGSLDTDSMDAKQALRVVIAYRDLPAGKRAMHVMSGLGKGLGDEIEFQPVPWSFELLADRDWSEVATRDAINADILIVATSSANALPPAVARWVESTINQKQGTAAAVIALFGSEANPDEVDTSRVDAIQTAARQAGLDFFAPPARHGFEQTKARIPQGTGMVTPLLDEILQHHYPVPHWGINE